MAPVDHDHGDGPVPLPGPDEVQELGPASTGTWLVTTLGSRHIWDLDDGTYCRLTGPGREAFDQDRLTVKITRVSRWPRVGATSLVWFDDPTNPTTHEQWRQSSTIQRIQRLPSRSRPSKSTS